MSLQQLRKEIQELKEAVKIKKVLPWDCKNLMSRYKEERARREILCKLYDLTGEAYEPPGPYILEVENQKGLSREAREFLSLSAEKQADVVKSKLRWRTPLQATGVCSRHRSKLRKRKQ